jgi:hypothetical protein
MNFSVKTFSQNALNLPRQISQTAFPPKHKIGAKARARSAKNEMPPGILPASLDTAQSRPPGADGQPQGFFFTVTADGKLLPADHAQLRTPGRRPVFSQPAAAAHDHALHAVNTGTAPAPDDLGIPTAVGAARQAEFRPQFLMTHLRRQKRRLPSAVLFVGKKGGMDSTFVGHPHEKAMRAMRRLVNPADAGRSRWLVHWFNWFLFSDRIHGKAHFSNTRNRTLAMLHATWWKIKCETSGRQAWTGGSENSGWRKEKRPDTTPASFGTTH